MEKYTEEQLLELLAKDREAGAEAVWEMYSGLIWRVCARRLQNAEDVKESVNSTFADFCMNWRQYDPSKGTLRNYICTIGDRKAMELYRKNDARHRAEEKAIQEEAEGQAWQEYPSEDRRVEKLEEALKTLSPLDEKILRMKYYDGMTFKEIAAKMELPYDTVKKRGERSLKKLWKILIVALLLAALTGCALWLYHHFQFSEKAGINWDVESPMYELEGESPSAIVNGVRITVADASYQDGMLTVKYTGEPVRTLTVEEEEHTEYFTFGTITTEYLNQLQVKGGTGDVNSQVRLNGVIMCQATYMWPGEATDGTISIHLEKEDRTGMALAKTLQNNGLNIQEDVDLAEQPLSFDFTLQEVEIQDGDIRTLGDLRWFEGGGFLVRDGKVVANGATVPMYAFDINADFTVSNRLTGSLTGYQNFNDIVLVGEDGIPHPMTHCIGIQASSREAKEMYFEGVSAGEYTLKIPYLIVNSIEKPEAVSLPIPEKNGEYQELDRTFTMADGSQLKLIGITRSTNETMTVDQEADGTLIEIVVEYPELLLDYEIIPADDEPSFCGVRFSVQYQGTTKDGVVLPQMSGGIMSGNAHRVAVGLIGEFASVDPEITFQIEEGEFALEKDYEIPVTIE